MKFHQGRLLDHVHLRVADMERSKRFYRAVLNALGRDLTMENVEAVFHGPAHRSAASVEITPATAGGKP